VLLSLRNRLTVALCPTHVALTVSGRGWRPEFSKPVVLSAESSDGATGWQAPLAALVQWLEQNKLAQTDVEVILSDSFVRYALVPWSDDVQKPSELAAFSRIYFEALFGAKSADWEIQIDVGDYGMRGIGCALDKGLIEALHGLAKKYAFRLTLLQPYFMHVFNRWRGHINRNALLAVVDSRLCMMATFMDGCWHSVRAVRVGENVGAELPRLIERELLLQGMDVQSKVYLHMLTPIDTAVIKRDMRASLLISNSEIEQEAGLTMLLCGDK
jgi:hypothetical protein